MPWIESLPLHQPGLLLVLADVAHELPLQVWYRIELAARDHVTLSIGKPEVDLFQRHFAWLQ